MNGKTSMIIIFVLVLAIIVYLTSIKEGMEMAKYRTADGTQMMEEPITYKKCLCNQQGSAMYPAYDALGTRLFRTVNEWEPKQDQKYDAKYFSAVI
jgi:hypothetical protein